MSNSIHMKRVETSGEAGRYILIPKYKVALPLSETPESQIASYLVGKADYDLPERFEDYPVVSSHILKIHFSDYEITERLVTIETVIPIRAMTYLERETRKERLVEARKRDAAERRQADLASRAVAIDLSLFSE